MGDLLIILIELIS